MPISTKTKAVVGLAALDVIRQGVTAWSAREQARRDEIGFGQGLRRDVRRLASDARGHAPDLGRWELEWGLPPIRRRSTRVEQARAWVPIVAVIAAATAALLAVAHVVSRRDEDRDPEEVASDPLVVSAVRAGSTAIDAGVTKVVEGGTGVAVGAASTVAAGSTAIKAAAVDTAKTELDERVVQPVKKKATIYGSLGLLGLTVYIIVIAAIVQLLVEAIG
jgi:hypothetical protein